MAILTPVLLISHFHVICMRITTITDSKCSKIMHKQTAMIIVWKHIGRKMYEKWFSESICRDSHDDEYTPPWIVELNSFSRIYMVNYYRTLTFHNTVEPLYNTACPHSWQ